MKKEKIIAVIDIGAHSIKLHIGEIGKKKNIKKLEYLWVPVAIGRDTFNKGLISNPTINEVIKSFKGFVEVIKSYKIRQFRAIATSSVREAGNSDVLIERVYKSTGVRIEIIEPLEEMEIIYLGIKNILKKKFALKEKNVLFFSLGGGSTQILLQSKGKVVFSETHHLGTLRIGKDFDFSDRSYRFSLHPFAVSFEKTVNRFSDIAKLDGFVAINDDVLTVVQKVFPEYLEGDVFKIPRKDFNRFYGQIDRMTLEEMRTAYQLNENVLKTTKIAALLFGSFFDLSSANSVIIPNISTSYFMLYRTAFLENRKTEVDDDLREDILSTVMAIGRKYQFDREHALQVRKIAMKMIDQMQAQYGFTEKEKLYLEVAALLHDIGVFVNANEHHKQSMQLIQSSEIMGLQQQELNIISQVARYHRKSPPKTSHSNYNELSMEERITVSRLAAVLRVADALDNAHSQSVDDLELRLDDEKCEIKIDMKEDQNVYLGILRTAVRKKSDMFESFYGVPVRLEKKI